MEEDIDVLGKALSNLEATESQNDKISNYEELYKNCWRLGNQEDRRIQLLEVQKSNRNNKIDKFRGILELVTSEENLFEPHNRVPYKPNIYVPGFIHASHSYKNVLMLSEWMIEKPKDFSENWYIVPCPKGTRLLVIANKGRTKFFTKYGYFKFERHTALPGGSIFNNRHKSYCILDGFYYEKTNTLYLLDVLAWTNQPMTDGETEFRHYWLKTKLEELPETKRISKKNKVIIKMLPMLPCTEQFLSCTLKKYPPFENNMPPLDGLLFYHKRAHYVSGETPLVGWLYPFMIPEVLGEEFELHPGFMKDMPEGYVNQADFIQKFEEDLAKKNQMWSRQASEMETDSYKNESAIATNNIGDNTSTSMEQENKSDVK